MDPVYCNDKRAYDKKSAVTAQNKRYREEHILLRLYPCGDHWHLTKQLRGTKHLIKNFEKKYRHREHFKHHTVARDYEIE